MQVWFIVFKSWIYFKVWNFLVIGPFILKLKVLDIYSPVLGGCSTIEAAKVKSEEEMLHVMLIFCQEEKKFHNLQWIGGHNLLNER